MFLFLLGNFIVPDYYTSAKNGFLKLDNPGAGCFSGVV